MRWYYLPLSLAAIDRVNGLLPNSGHRRVSCRRSRLGDAKVSKVTSSLRIVSLRASEDGNDVSAVDIPRPSPDILVSSLSEDLQKGAVAAIAVGLLAGTSAVVGGLDGLEDLNEGIFGLWKLTWPVGLGVIYAAAGATHFTNKADYEAIMPPPGTWGFFTVPYLENTVLDYAAFAVAWTGVAEIAGGLSLFLGGFDAGPVPVEVASGCLLLLTAAITPANVYMFTHDAQMGELPPVPYPAGHIFRGALQCVLLGLLWKITFP
mmetsp:Transcript_1276/g.2714  ORF Transcript_1276/g.2714 Transcript_1276/m.2714 type:complete len:262 (+) Transcript_1276:85-870(+)